MKRKFVLISLILLVMLTVGAVAASGSNDNLTTNSKDSLSLNDDVSNKDTGSSANNDKLLKVNNNESLLKDSGSFTELDNLISTSTGTVTLNKNYTCLDSETTYKNGIVISTNNLIIDGNNYVIDAAGFGRIFQVTGTGVTLKNIKFINAYSEERYYNGIGVYWTGNDGTVSNCTFVNNTGNNIRFPTYGGAIYSTSERLLVEKSTFIANAAEFGAAVYLTGENTTVKNCIFNQNNAYYSGAGIYLISPNGLIERCEFNNNTAVHGAGVWFGNEKANETIKVQHSNFVNNTAYMGGAIFANTYDGSIYNNTFYGKNQIDIVNASNVGVVDIYLNTETSSYNDGYIIQNDGRITISKNKFLNTIVNKKTILSDLVYTITILRQHYPNVDDPFYVEYFLTDPSDEWNIFSAYDVAISITIKPKDSDSSYYSSIVSENLLILDEIGDYYSRTNYTTLYSLTNTGSKSEYLYGEYKFYAANYAVLNLLKPGSRQLYAYDPGISSLKSSSTTYAKVLGTYTDLQYAIDNGSNHTSYLSVPLLSDFLYWPEYDNSASNPLYSVNGALYTGKTMTFENGVNITKSRTHIYGWDAMRVIDANNQSALINVIGDEVEMGYIKFTNTNPFKYFIDSGYQTLKRYQVGLNWYGDDGLMSACHFQSFSTFLNSTNTNILYSNYLTELKESYFALKWWGDNGVVNNTIFSNVHNSAYSPGNDTEGGLSFYSYMVIWAGENATLDNINIYETNVRSVLNILTENATLHNIKVQNTIFTGNIINLAGSNSIIDGLYVKRMGVSELHVNAFVSNTYSPSIVSATDQKFVGGERVPLNNITIKNVYAEDCDFKLIVLACDNSTISNVTCKNLYTIGIVLDTVYLISENLIPNYKLYDIRFEDCYGVNAYHRDSITGLLEPLDKEGPILIYVVKSNVELYNASFISNDFSSEYDSETYDYVYGGGHAIYIYGQMDMTFIMDNCTFYNNTGFSAPCIYAKDAKVNISNTKFINTSGTKDATVVIICELYMENCLFENIYVSERFGALRLSGNSTVVGTEFKNCYSNGTSSHGAAIIIDYDTSVHSSTIRNILIDNCTFFNCSASYGGAISLNTSYSFNLNNFNLLNSIFEKNTARKGNGGAICLQSTNIYIENSTLIDNCTFKQNHANSGGAISFYSSSYASSSFTSNINNCTFQENHANSTGSAIISSISMNIYNSHFINNGRNEAKFNDTSITFSNRTFVIENCTFNNTINSTFLLATTTVTSINLTNIVELSPMTTAPLNYTYYTDNSSPSASLTYNSLVFAFILQGPKVRFSNNSLNNTIYLYAMKQNPSNTQRWIFGNGVVSVLSPVTITYLDNKTYFVEPFTKSYGLYANITDDNGNRIVTDSIYMFYDKFWADYDSKTTLYFATRFDYYQCFANYSTTGFVYFSNGGKYTEWMKMFNISAPITNITHCLAKSGFSVSNPVFLNATLKKGVLSTLPNSYTYLQGLIDNATEGSVIILNDSITFNSDYDLATDNPYYGKINFTNGVLINKTITIVGKNKSIYISGDNQARIFIITVNNTVIKDISLNYGYTTSKGGAIYYNNTVNSTLDDVTLNNNRGVNSSGGACYFEKCVNISLFNVSGWYNSVVNADGGVYYFNNCSNINVMDYNNYLISGRTVPSSGAYVYNGVTNGSGGVFFINNSHNIIIHNSAMFHNKVINGSGGAYYILNSNNISMSYSNLILNTAINSVSEARVYYNNTAINGSVMVLDGISDFILNGQDKNYPTRYCLFDQNYASGSATIYITNSSNVLFNGTKNYMNDVLASNHSVKFTDFYIDGDDVILYNCSITSRNQSIIWIGNNGSIIDSYVYNYDDSHMFVEWLGKNGTIINSTFDGSNIVKVIGSLTLINNTLRSYAIASDVIVENCGNLSLKGNKLVGYIKNFEGVILSDTYATVINNKTYILSNDTYFILFVNITDDMNNTIVSNSTIIYNNTTPWNATYNITTGYKNPYMYYNWTIDSGEYKITATDDNLLNLTVKSGYLLCKQLVLLPITINQTNEGEIVVINATITGMNITDGSLITFYVNGDEYNGTTINNTAILTLHNLLPGFYKVVATYGGNNSVLGVTNITNFTVDFLNTTLNITATNITFFGNYTTISYVIGNGTANLTGTVSFIIDDITYTVNVNKTSFDIILPRVGTYYITGIYSGDKYHRASRNTTKCEVVKRDTPISISNKELEIGVNVTLEVVIDSHATGNITISVNGVETVVNISSDHVARLNLTKVVAGTYYVKATYDGNDYCKANFTNTTFFVVKKVLDADLNITSSNITVIFSQNITTGDVLFDINGTGYWAKIVNGTATIPMPDNLKPGIYNITAFYPGDDVWNNITLSGLYEINFKHPLLIVLGSNIFLGDDDNIHVVLTPEATGSVELYVDGSKVHTFTNATYVMNYTVSGLTAGLHNITAKYSGDDQYYPASNSTFILVSLVGGFEFNILVNDTVIGAKNNVTIKLPRNATGNVSIPGYGSVVLVNGSATIELNASYIAGKNGIVVTYTPDEDSEYDSSVRSAYYNVYKHSSSINITNILISNSVINITVSTPNSISEIVINNKKYSVVNGTVLVPRVDLNSGNYTVIANAYEDDYYLFATNSTTFDLAKANITAEINVNDGKITVTFSEDVEGEVLFNINGTLIWANIDENKAVIDIPSYLSAGNYTVIASFKGNERYANTTLIDNFTIDKQNTTVVVIGSHIFVGEDEIINIVIAPDATGNITLYIDDVLVKTFNNLSNILTYTAEKLDVGRHNITAVYSGDNKYMACQNITYFSVIDKEDDFFNITINDTYVGGKTNVVIRVPVNATGFVTVDGYWHVRLVNGTATIEVTAERAGINRILVEYTPDTSSSYENKSKIASYYAYKYNSTIVLTNIDVNTENITLTVNTPNSESYIIFYNVKYDIVNSTVVIPRGNLKSGNHTIILNAVEDDIYLSSSNITVFEIPQLDLSAVMNVDGENITVTFAENITGEILFDINGTHIWAEVVNGKAVTSIPSLIAGNYNVTAIFKGDDVFAPMSVYYMLTVDKTNSTIIPIASDIYVGNDGVLCIVTSPNATGKVELYLNGILTKTYTDLTGLLTYSLKELAAGAYDVEVRYSGDDKYLSSTNKTSFLVFEIEEFFFIVDVKDVPVGEKANVTILVAKNATGSISIDGYGSVVIVNGTAKFQLNASDIAGRKSITANYIPDEKSLYNATSKIANYNVIRLNPSIIITVPSNIKNGDGVNVEITTNSDGNLSVVINGVEYTTNVINLKPSAGNYTVVAKTQETDKYFEAINFTSFIVPEANVVVVVSMDGIDPMLDIYTPLNATGNVTVKIGNETFTAPIENGHAKLNISGITPGDYEITTSFMTVNGDAINENSTITIPEPVLIATVINVEHVDGKMMVTCVLKDINGNILPFQSVSYKMNGISGNDVTDENGSFTVKCVQNSELYVEFEGYNVYGPSNTTIKLDKFIDIRNATDIQANVYTTYAVDFYIGERGHYFNFRLVDANGKLLANKPIKIGFNGVVYDRVTDSNGNAKLQINLNTPYIYTFAIAFLGDETHNASFVVQKIIVNKKTTKLSASAKTFKASAKTKSYTVTLKSNVCSSIDGKSYMGKGKTITLKVNGKTYTGHTNDKGKVTFKLKLTKKGTYTASINFVGDVRYAASKTTAKIKIS